MDDEIKDALRLAKRSRPLKSVEPMPDYMRPYKDLTEEEKQKFREHYYNSTSPKAGSSVTSPRSRASDKTPRYSIPEEDYLRGNMGEGEYAMARGGPVARHGYALGGNPTDPVAGTNPATATPTVSPYQNYVNSLYKNVMGREADAGGQQYWTDQLNSGAQTTQNVLDQFAASKEFQNLYSSNPNQAVSNLYQTALSRAPEQAGLDYWTQQAKGGPNAAAYQQAQDKYTAESQNYNQQMANYNSQNAAYDMAMLVYQLYGDQTVKNMTKPTPPTISAPAAPQQSQFNQAPMSASQLLDQFQTAQEYQTRDRVLNDYIKYTGEAPGAEQYASAAQAIAGGKTLNDVSAQISSSPEAARSLVGDAYKEILGRSADTPAMNYWTNQLTKGTLTPDDFIKGLTTSSEGVERANERTVDNMYQEMFGRAPIPADKKDPNSIYNDSLSKMAAGTLDYDGLQKAFSSNPEAARYQDTTMLKDIIQQLTGKEASAKDINNYLPRLTDKSLGPATLYSEIYNSPASKEYQLKNLAPKEYGPSSAAEAQKSVPGDSATLQDFFGPVEKAGGLPPGVLLSSMGIESTFGKNQQGKVPQYKGAFQMGTAERRSNGVSNPWNWQQSAIGAARYMVKNAETFKDKTGKAPTAADFYGMHLQGANGWASVVNKPDALATKTLGYQKVLQNIPADVKVDLKTLTNGQFREIFSQKFLKNLQGPDGKGLDILNLNPDGTTRTAPGTPVTPSKPGDQGSITPPPINLGVALAQVGAGGGTAANSGGQATVTAPPVINPGATSWSPSGGVDIAKMQQDSAAAIAAALAASTVNPFIVQGATGTSTGGWNPAMGTWNNAGGYGGAGGGNYGYTSGYGYGGSGSGGVGFLYKNKGGAVWDKPRPKSLGKPDPLSKKQKSSAKAAAKAAGRPYPNLVDNMRAAQKSHGGALSKAMNLTRRILDE